MIGSSVYSGLMFGIFDSMFSVVFDVLIKILKVYNLYRPQNPIDNL